MASSLSSPSVVPSTAQPLNLESELSCAICTEILYQPLTLLDCLHTFCGSCLKEWFSQTVASGRHTCPSCRATVRDTRPNATVTCLLDLFLQANPGKAKAEEEGKEIAAKYKPGEDILRAPRQSSRSERQRAQQDAEEEEDRRILEEIRELSIRDVDGSGSRRSSQDRLRERSARRQPGEARSRSQRRDISPHASARLELQTQLRVREGLRPGRSLRTLEHQHSLRSLLHTANSDPEVSQAVQQDILRQINEGGLLDGIDTSDIDVHNEDAIPEMIARAYLRRREEQANQQRRRDRTSNTGTPRNGETADTSSRPPVSRPHLISASTEAQSVRPRTSSQGRSRSATRPVDTTSSVDNGSRTSPRTVGSRATSSGLLTVEPTPRQRRRSHEAPAAGNGQARLNVDPQAAQQRNLDVSPRPGSRSVSSVAPARSRSSLDVPSDRARQHRSRSRGDRAATAPVSNSSSRSTTIRSVPSISCSSCTRPDIQHSLHYICTKCAPSPGLSTFALCARCYRSGKGCNNWSGFGRSKARSAPRSPLRANFAQEQEEAQHSLRAQRYALPSSTNASPTYETGLFCSTCSALANAAYWHCGTCNSGEWGYCIACVHTARHCSHPLLPLGSESIYGPISPSELPWQRPTAELTAALGIELDANVKPLPIVTACEVCNTDFKPKERYFHCPSCATEGWDVCSRCYEGMVGGGAIAAKDGPNGWRKCCKGHRMQVVVFEDYADWVRSADIETAEGLRRVVVQEVVGGWRLKDEDQDGAAQAAADAEEERGRRSQAATDTGLAFSWLDPSSGGWRTKRAVSQSADPRGPGMPHHSSPSSPPATNSAALPSTQSTAQGPLPPSGGHGNKLLALWTRQPEEGVGDELEFPRGAEITEVFEINEGWSWGVYCRVGGMFPSAFGRRVG